MAFRIYNPERPFSVTLLDSQTIFLKKIYLLLTILLVAIEMGTSQDAHFTQFYNIPAFANPAFVGTSNNTYRISSIYRDQWRSALERPVSTFAFSGDLKFPAGSGSNSGDFFGAGIMFYHDKLGAISYTTNQIAVSGSYTKMLDRKTNQYLGIGLQTAIQQKSINYSDITFQDQFNAIDGFTLPTGEELPANNLGFFDLNLGVNYSISPSSRQTLNLGIAGFHLLAPNISFYSRDEILKNQISIESKLPRRWTAHGSYSNHLDNSKRLETRLVYNNQGPYQEANISAIMEFTNPSFKSKGFFVGPGLRVSKAPDTWGMESANITAGLFINKLLFSFRYENALKNLGNAGRNFNAFEFSFILLGDYTNDVDICPKF